MTTTGDTVHCCGNEGQVIELRGGGEPLVMVRCATCARREWRVGDEPVAVDHAFALLAQAYRAVPRAARAARQRSAVQTSARAAARAARVTPTRAPAATTAASGVDRDDLAALLQGWTVLGATG